MKLSFARRAAVVFTAFTALSLAACSAETDDGVSGDASEVTSAKAQKLEGVFAKDWSAESDAIFLRVGGENVAIDLEAKKLTKSFVFGARAAL